MDIPHSSTLPRYYIDNTADGPILRVSADNRQSIVILKGGLGQLQLRTWPNPWCFFASPTKKLIDSRHPESAILLAPEWAEPRLIAVKERRLMLIYWNHVIKCYGKEGMVWTAELYLMKAFVDLSLSGAVLTGAMDYSVENDDLMIQMRARDRMDNNVLFPIRLSIATGEPK